MIDDHVGFAALTQCIRVVAQRIFADIRNALTGVHRVRHWQVHIDDARAERGRCR